VATSWQVVLEDGLQYAVDGTTEASIEGVTPPLLEARSLLRCGWSKPKCPMRVYPQALGPLVLPSRDRR